jgi:hypothetical protein
MEACRCCKRQDREADARKTAVTNGNERYHPHAALATLMRKKGEGLRSGLGGPLDIGYDTAIFFADMGVPA